MTKKDNKKPPKPIHSSTAQYLTFISASGDDPESIEVRYEDENIWMTQKMMAELYGVSVQMIGQHIKKLTVDGEISDSVIKQYFITASDGKNYNTIHYNLQAIISVGFKIENDRAVQFRKWARQIVKDYTIQGWTMDSERNIPMTMEDWSKRLNSFLEFNGREILMDAGKISHEEAKLHAETQFEKYRIIQDRLFESDFDREVKKMLKKI